MNRGSTVIRLEDMRPKNPHVSKKRKSPWRNWLPNQHGAWFIVIVPALFGATLGGWVWQHALLLPLWIIGFFFVFAGLRWVKNPRRRDFRAPVIAYGVSVCVLGVQTLLAMPRLAFWIPVFAVILGFWVWEVWRGRERELGARLSIILAAGVMTLVAYHCGLMGTALRLGQPAVYGVHEAPVWGGHALGSVLRGWPAVGMIAGLLTAYYAASVPYVKTVFRRRGDRRFLVISVVTHAACLVASIVFAVLHWVSPLVAVVWTVALARAIWFPWQAARRGKPWRPRVVGLTEVGISVLVFIAIAI